MKNHADNKAFKLQSNIPSVLRNKRYLKTVLLQLIAVRFRFEKIAKQIFGLG